MRVIFLSPHSDPEAELGEPDAGGQCVYQHQLAQELSQKGLKVDTFCRQVGKRPDISSITDNYTIHRLQTGEASFIPKELLESELRQFVIQLNQELTSTIQPGEKVVIHAHYWDGGKASLMLKYNYHDWPLVWTPHSLGSVKRKKFDGVDNEVVYNFLPRLAWENYTAYCADRVIVSSQDERQQLLQDYSIVRDMARVIPPGLTLDRFVQAQPDKARARFGLKPGKKILLCLGRMARSKGYHHALHLAKHLKDIWDEDFLILIVGGTSTKEGIEEKLYFQELQSLVSELAIESKVAFFPAVPYQQVADVFSLADMFLMTSENEPFGLTTIEAMASGTPVVGHFTGGTRSIIAHEQTGFLVNMHQYQQVAHDIKNWLQQPQVLRQIANRAYEQVQAEYSWKGKVDDFIQIYSKVSHQRFKKINWLTQNNYFLRKNLEV